MAILIISQQEALNRAFSAYKAGKFIETEQICHQILSAGHNNSFDALHLLAVVQSSMGKYDLALAIYNHALTLRPNCAEAFNNRGLTLHRLKLFEDACSSYDQALVLRPHYAEALCNRGLALYELKRFDEGLLSFDRALTIRPTFSEALCNRGLTLNAIKRFNEALASYDQALALQPDYIEALYNRGNTLMELNQYDDALTNYNRVLTLRPNYVEAICNRGVALQKLNRLEEALVSYNCALSLWPGYIEAIYNLATGLQESKRFDQALAMYDRAIAIRPDNPELFISRGNALKELKRFDEALASYDRALTMAADHAEALNNRGTTLRELKRFDEALANFEAALAIQPNHVRAFSGLANCVIQLCEWKKRSRVVSELKTHVCSKKSIISPFLLLGCTDDPSLHLQCARNKVANVVPVLPKPLCSGETWRNDKVRIAYLSADYQRHPTAYLMAELFERHDRSRFDIIGVSFGMDDLSEMRKRLLAAFDQFHDVREKSDEEVARLVRRLQIDIAIDLKGYTQDSRPAIFAYRPAPVQVNYLGYPGTMGAEFIDYIIADEIVVPFEQRKFYAEKIAYLPDCYQVNDTKRKSAERVPTRQEVGLPEQGFVFCCFNNHWKITPEIFDIWMRLLRNVEGSVLWLLFDNENAKENLRREANARGVDTSRLVFASKLPLEKHLARYRLAGLFLDTLPYNAHTTASDAISMGLPVLTCKGHAFAGRVAASLLHAVGIPELVTCSLEEYEARALNLARDPFLLSKITEKLISNRSVFPLFNIDCFTRHIESAYRTMWEIWQRGERPESFSVLPIKTDPYRN